MMGTFADRHAEQLRRLFPLVENFGTSSVFVFLPGISDGMMSAAMEAWELWCNEESHLRSLEAVASEWSVASMKAGVDEWLAEKRGPGMSLTRFWGELEQIRSLVGSLSFDQVSGMGNVTREMVQVVWYAEFWFGSYGVAAKRVFMSGSVGERFLGWEDATNVGECVRSGIEGWRTLGVLGG